MDRDFVERNSPPFNLYFSGTADIRTPIGGVRDEVTALELSNLPISWQFYFRDLVLITTTPDMPRFC